MNIQTQTSLQAGAFLISCLQGTRMHLCGYMTPTVVLNHIQTTGDTENTMMRAEGNGAVADYLLNEVNRLNVCAQVKQIQE